MPKFANRRKLIKPLGMRGGARSKFKPTSLGVRNRKPGRKN